MINILLFFTKDRHKWVEMSLGVEVYGGNFEMEDRR